MAQQLVTSAISTNIPDAYPFITVQSTPVGLGSSGIIVIFGEADGGDSYGNVSLKNNYFTPNQLAKVKQQYVSGQVVDAFQALSAPANDPDITGSANRVYIAKTNAGTQASAIVDTDYGTLKDKNWGRPGNNYRYQITSTASETTPTVSGSTIGAFGAPLNGTSFKIRLNGGATSTVTLVDTGAFEEETISVPATAGAAQADYIVLHNEAGTSYAFWLDIDANGTTPTGAAYVAATNKIKVSIASAGPNNTAIFNAGVFATAAAAMVGTTVLDNGNGTVTLTQTIVGVVTTPARHNANDSGNGSFTFVVNVAGAPDNLDNITDVISVLNGVLPSGIVASPGTASNSLKLTISTDSSANRKGWGKSFELIDSTPGDLAALGLVAGLSVSSQEPSVEVAINNSVTGLSQTVDVNSDFGLTLGCVADTAVLTIDATNFTVTVSGGAGSTLTIPVAQYSTISDLVTFINTKTAFSATVSSGAEQLSPSVLDKVTSVGVASSGAALKPGRIKRAAKSFFNAVNNSALGFTVLSGGSQGLPKVMASPVFLAGGARGATTSNDIVSVLAQIGGIQCNFIVPLFSRDYGADIAAGLTDSNSTYTISAVNAAVKNHCIAFSIPQLKRNRSAILSIKDTYSNAKAAAQSIGNYRCSMTMQDVTQLNSSGVSTVFQPWYGAVIAAGMQTGGFYKAILNKGANVISFTDPTGFDSGDPGDVSDALNAGLLFLSADATRNYWVSDQTTFGLDSSFVYNSIQAVYTSDLVALDLAQSFKLNFVGKSLADVDASAGLAFLAQKMDGYKKLKLIGASSDAPLGYKNQHIEISGPEMDVAVEIKLATALYFIPININISQIQSAA